ncbi:hypothetical protein [Salinigranum marinum]|uniref:hypothetical protein n=1 Tax=Salinigranum marinum TaxID=1515595 RepID=UPI002989A471|nr:hypothetical protein [Salinigranum marinum]
MPMKGRGTGQLREIDRWDGGVGWLAHPEEGMQRASHALAVGSSERSSAGSRTESGDDEAWVVDPVDAPGLDDLLASVGDVAGVVVCLDRHKRDAAAVARRHDVPVYVPDWMTGVASKLDAPTERFGRELADTGYRALTIVDRSLPPWQEVGLYHDETGTLVVPEALGTASYFCAPGEPLGVHPMLRPAPPKRAFRGLDPERVLVGHGEGVFDDAATAVHDALDNARSRLPAAYARAFRELL